jgi:hypothetical protein
MNSEFRYSRTKEEYIEMKERLRVWTVRHMDADPNPVWFCGRTMEYSWHIIFTQRAFVDACHICQSEVPTIADGW